MDEMRLKREEADKCAKSLRAEAEQIKTVAKSEHKKFTDARKVAQESDEALTKAMTLLNTVFSINDILFDLLK